MFQQTIVTLAATFTALALAAPVAAYDKALAQSYAQFFEPVQGAKAGKAFHLIKAEDLVARIKSGEKLIGLDIRTPAESGIFTTALPGSLAIPLHELFKAESLDRLPTNKTIVVVCTSGTRAAAAATALRHVGFDGVYILRGGFKALANYLDARTANMPLGPKHAGK